MKILVIGGTRFFGKRAVQMLLEAGHSVTILTRGIAPDTFGNRVQRIVADRTDAEQLKSAIKQDYDVVIDNMLMNAKEAESVLSIFKDRIEHYVMTSTLAVYDPKPGALTEEDFVPKTLSSGTSYQEGKRNAELVLKDAAFSVGVMRIPIIVGNDDYTQRLLLHIRAAREGLKIYIPQPEARFSYLHAHDAARALAWLCQTKNQGTYNISAPNAWTLRELFEQIESVTGKNFIYGNSEDEMSPYGIPQDYYMDTSKALTAGFQVFPLENWMPQLLQNLNRSLEL